MATSHDAPGSDPGPDGRGREELASQVRFLEAEVSDLRRRLTESPTQSRGLELRLADAQRSLAGVTSQNERLAQTLREARDQIMKLKEEVDRLAQPPAGFGTFLARNEDDSVDVHTGGRKLRVSVSPNVDLDALRRGQEVMLNEALNVVAAFDYEEVGEVVMFKELLADGDRALVIANADEERVVRLAEPLRQDTIRAGDSLLLDARAGYVYEKVPKSEVEELVLEEVPDIAYESIGGLRGQIEAIQDAVELPYLYPEFFNEMDSLFRTRGTGVSSDVENTIVPQLLSEIDGVELLENVLVIGASNREDMIDPAILRPGRLDVKIKIERPDAEAARDIFSKYVTSTLPIHADDLAEHGGSRPATIAAMIQRAVERMYTESEDNRFLEVTYANGDKEVLYFKDFNSGAMIQNIVDRAKKMAIKDFLEQQQKGLRMQHLVAACLDEFRENEDLPNTTNPDDWARISGKKGERIVYIRTLVSGKGPEAGRAIDTISNTGQYL